MQLFRRLFRSRDTNPDDVAGMPFPPETKRVLTDRDQFIISYPRSGNTWTRYLVHDLLLLAHPDQPAPEKRGSLIPDIHQPLKNTGIFADFGLSGRLMKSHNIRDLLPFRFVYVARDPIDTLVSYFHYHCRFDTLKEIAGKGVDSFCESRLSGWIKHVEIAVDAYRKNPSRVLIATYENLHSDGATELERIARFLGIPNTADTLAKSLSSNSFERLRSSEEETRARRIAAESETGVTSGVSKEEFFFRKGQSNSGVNELAAPVAEKIRACTADLVNRVQSITRESH